MTNYEMFKVNESVFRAVVLNGVCVEDVQHVEMYEHFCRMEREGHKKTFIVAYLCEQYGVSETTLYRVANRMKKELAAF